MLLNHLAVPVPDIAVLGDAGGFALALSCADGAAVLPAGLHIGFMQDNETAVREACARLMAAGVELEHPLEWFAGALGFHCRAPGGLLVEVSWRPGAL